MSDEKPSNPVSDDVKTPAPTSDVKVEVTGPVPVEMKQATTQCAMNMTEEEREQFYKRCGPEHYSRYCEAKKTGCFERCRKTDWCKVYHEQKNTKEETLEKQIELLQQQVAALSGSIRRY